LRGDGTRWRCINEGACLIARLYFIDVTPFSARQDAQWIRYIDLLYLHIWDGTTPVEEILRAIVLSLAPRPRQIDMAVICHEPL
jgi:hypothetical protein